MVDQTGTIWYHMVHMYDGDLNGLGGIIQYNSCFVFKVDILTVRHPSQGFVFNKEFRTPDKNLI